MTTMTQPESLRTRLVRTGMLIGLSVVVCFGVLMQYALDAAQDIWLDAHRAEDVQSFIAQYHAYPGVLTLPRSNFRVYVSSVGDVSGLPPELRSLAPGEDEVVIDDRIHALIVIDEAANRYWFLFDDSTVESYEHYILISIVGAGIACLLIAWLLTRKLATDLNQPLALLAQRAQGMDPGQRPEHSLATDAGDVAEVQMLATALDAHIERIHVLLEREREFSGDVSHELRTPVMGILGAAENLARRPGLAEADRELITRITRNCTAIRVLIDALLSLARDSSAAAEMREPVSLLNVVNEQIAAHSAMAQMRGITLNLSGESERPIPAVRAVVDIVVANLLGNAVKHTTGPEISVHVDGDRLTIADQGPGIEDDARDRVFERFERGKGRCTDGNGIGLALVRRFCDQFGWRLDMARNEAHGTTVCLHFV
ncbi:MAG: HAMP domain-containing histidine kinase [Gammaproteobacteria bacterium]|nr:HAMP domain-containing histidine kinase [Gammaproteobacteria bacterium]